MKIRRLLLSLAVVSILAAAAGIVYVPLRSVIIYSILPLGAAFGWAAFLLYNKAADEISRRDKAEAELLASEAKYRNLAENIDQLARELRTSEEKFRQISETARDAIIMMNHTGKITFWNKAAQGMFGYSAAKAHGKNLHGLIVPLSYREAYQAGLKRFIKTGAGPAVGKTTEIIAVKKDGSEFAIALSLSAVRLNDQWHAIGIVRDISERKLQDAQIKNYSEQLEQIVQTRTRALQNSLQDSQNARNRIDGIIQSVAACLIVTDMNNNVVLLNARAEKLLGVDFLAAVNQPIDTVIKYETLRKQIQQAMEAPADEQQFDLDWPDNGAGRIMQTRTSKFHDAAANIIGIVALISVHP